MSVQLLQQAAQLLAQGDAEAAWARISALDLSLLDAEGLYLAAGAAALSGRAQQSEALLAACLARSPRHPGARFQTAVLAMERGQSALAREGFAAVAAEAPGFAEAHYNLGVLLAADGEVEAAAAAYGRALLARPGLVQAANNLANLRLQQGRRAEAEALLREAVAQAPGFAEGWCSLGRLLVEAQRLEAASAALGRAIELAPTLPEAWANLMQLKVLQGERAGAEKAALRLLELDPRSERAQFQLAALRGEPLPRPPDSVVKALFDGMAEEFDARLVEGLGYRFSLELPRYLGPSPSTPRLDVLDLGCGTGLAGPILRPLARRLEGVDLSSAMVEKALARGVYDRVRACSLQVALQGSGDTSWDLLVAADVLIYVGDPEPLLAEAGRVLRPGGSLLCSLETAEDGRAYLLQPSGRYAHGVQATIDLAARFGLRCTLSERIELRRERGDMLAGQVLRLQRA